MNPKCVDWVSNEIIVYKLNKKQNSRKTQLVFVFDFKIKTMRSMQRNTILLIISLRDKPEKVQICATLECGGACTPASAETGRLVTSAVFICIPQNCSVTRMSTQGSFYSKCNGQ